MSRREIVLLSLLICSLVVIAIDHNPFAQTLDHREGVVRILKTQEGFSGSPYQDSGGVATIGYGTRLPLTPAEGELLLVHRLHEAQTELDRQWPEYHRQPYHVRQALSLMAYQLGIEGELRFKKMLRALREGDIDEAVRQALDSKWAHQTPHRTATVIAFLRGSSL